MRAQPSLRELSAAHTWARFAVGFAVLCVLSASVLVVALPFLPWRRRRIRVGNVHGKVIGRALLAVAGVRPVVHGRDVIEAASPAIYLCNHSSTLDVFISIWLCPMGGCGVAKHEIIRVPFFGWAWWLSGHLLLKRENRSSAIKAMSSIADEVKRHAMSVWLLPEGTRTRTGELLPFKKGFVHLALQTGLPVVPVVVHGADRHWPVDRLRFSPGDLHIEALEPISTKDWSLDDIDALIEEVRSQYEDALRRGPPTAEVREPEKEAA